MYNLANGATLVFGDGETNLNIPERVKKYWAMIMGDRPLSMGDRFQLYILGVLLGILLFLLLFPLLLLLPYLPFFEGNHVLQSAIVVLILTLPSVTLNWLIKNRDVSRQLKDSSQQLEYSSKQQNETLFSNSLQLLFKENDIIANSVGLKELVKLKQEERIDHERVNLVTSSGLQLEKASLLGAKLQEVNLYRANLEEANLQGAKLQGANLQEADLLGAMLERSLYDGHTIFPDGFDPEQHGMELIQEEDK